MFDIDRLKLSLLFSIAIHSAFFFILYLISYTPIEHTNDYLFVDFESSLIREEKTATNQIPEFDSDTTISVEDESRGFIGNNQGIINPGDNFTNEVDRENYPIAQSVTNEPDGNSFNINFGKMGARKIYSYTLPPIELGDSKEINIKLSFVILPDGTVGNIVPVKKVNTSLETQAIESLRQWRFEPLSRGKSQDDQTATIVFPFRQRL